MIGIVEIDGVPVFYEELDARVRREAERTGTLAYALLQFVERYIDPSVAQAEMVGRLGPNRAWIEFRYEKRVRFIVEATLKRDDVRQRLDRRGPGRPRRSRGT